MIHEHYTHNRVRYSHERLYMRLIPDFICSATDEQDKAQFYEFEQPVGMKPVQCGVKF